MSEQVTAQREERRDQARAGEMRAAVMAGPGLVRIHTSPLSRPGAGQVRVRLSGCGICGSNLPVWQGREWFKYPMEPGRPGHEGWGVVDEVGSGGVDFSPGDAVTFIGERSFAEYETVEAKALIRLPEELRDKPFPGEPFACAMNIIRRSGIVEGQKVAVVGVGFIGAMLVQLASRADCEVIAVSRRPFALSVARRCGAEHLMEMDDHYRVIEAVRRITDGKGCDVVIEAVGSQWPLDLAGELTATRGRLVIAGYHQEPRQVNMQLWNWRGLDVINAHERDPQVYMDGIRRAISAILAGMFDPFELLTHSYEMEHLGTAFADMQNRPDGFLKGYLRL